MKHLLVIGNLRQTMCGLPAENLEVTTTPLNCDCAQCQVNEAAQVKVDTEISYALRKIYEPLLLKKAH